MRTVLNIARWVWNLFYFACLGQLYYDVSTSKNQFLTKVLIRQVLGKGVLVRSQCKLYIMFVDNFAYFAFLAAKTRKTIKNSARALPTTQFQILLGGHHDSFS